MKKYKQFTSRQRYQIYGLKQAGFAQTRIAQKIGMVKFTPDTEVALAGIDSSSFPPLCKSGLYQLLKGTVYGKQVK